ncbi:hypothetical protein MRX96_041285 [Rhipicephalus microplus]
MYLWLVWLWLPTGWSLDTQFVPHPLRGSHVRATRFRPALVLKQGCDGAKFEYAYICVYDGVRWSDDSDIFLVVPTQRYEHTKIRARIDEFQAILLAHPQHVNVSLYDAYYTWGDILALPGPSAYDHVPGKSFTVKTVTDGSVTRYRSPTLNHTYAFAGEYYLTASLRPRVGRDVQLFSITKITVVDEPHVCRPRLQVNGLGPCGRPVAVSAKRPALVWVRSRVPERCSQPLEASTNVQFVVLYAGETSQPPLVQCSGSTNPPESCSRGDCIYRVTISKDCLRKGEMAKVVLRQMWRGKTDVLIESLAVGYLTATDGVVYASIDGAPMAFLSDAETLVLNGSGSVHLEGAPLFFNWSCEQCDKNGSLYQAFAKKRLDQQVIEIPDELRYGVSQEYRFVLHVSADGHSDRATITVWVPGDEDDKMVLSCPCCEFGVLSSEDLVIEARPQRTKVWDTRYPLVTWTISGPGGWLTEQRGAVLLLPAGNIVRSGLYRISASAWNKRPFGDIRYDVTTELFERQGLREQRNFPPVKGRCQLTPRKGIPVKTIFHVDCVGFADPEGGTLSYGFYFCSHASDTFAGLERPKPWLFCTHIKSSIDDGTFTGVLPPSNVSNCSVVVFVNDDVGQSVYDAIPVVVETGSCSDVTPETVEEYSRKSQQNSSNAILSYIKSASLLLNSNFYKECERNGSDVNRAFLNDYVGYLKSSNVSTESELLNVVSVIQELVPDNVSSATENTTNAVIELMDSYASTFVELTSDQSKWRIADLTATIGEDLIQGLTTLLDLKAPTPRETPAQVPSDFHIDSDCSTTEKLVHSTSRVAAGVARLVDTDENDVSINANNYEVWIREAQRQGFLGTTDGTRIRTKSNADAQTAIVFPSNPFRCHETAKLANTQAVGIQVVKGTAEISVNSPTESYLRRPTPLHFDSERYNTSFSNVSMHVINVTEAGVFLKIDVLPFKERRVITAVAHDRLPSRLDFLEQNRFHLTANVPNENRMEFVQKPTVVRLAVLPLANYSKTRLLDPYRARGEDNNSVTYMLRSSIYSCLFWNDTEHAYASEGCRVLTDSDDQFVHCTCEHNSIFAGGLFIAPHPIDFTDLGYLLLTMSTNVVMSVIVCTVWVVYLLVMAWAWKQDAKDEGAAGIEYLAENQQEDEFGYLISVYTWFLKGSGTTSRVLLVVQGSEEESRQVVLRDGARNPLALQAGGRDWFFLSHPSSLGDIEAIVLTVELKGHEGSWNLSTVVVRDLQTTSRTVFIVDKPLVPDPRTGVSVFTFQAADESLLRNPWRIFSARIIRYFREEHLIFSIFSRLPTSNLTRRQRASIALLLVTTGMMVSLMFYGLDADEDESFNWFFLNTLLEIPARREVIIALQSTILVTPFAFLVVFLFEKSRPPAYRRKPAVPKVYVDDVVEDWVRDTDSSVDSSKTGRVPRERLNENAQQPLFPTWVSAFAWILCLSASTVASALVVLYGLTYGYRRSLSWVRCNLINVILGEFVVSPLKILFLSAVRACVLKDTRRDGEHTRPVY